MGTIAVAATIVVIALGTVVVVHERLWERSWFRPTTVVGALVLIAVATLAVVHLVVHSPNRAVTQGVDERCESVDMKDGWQIHLQLSGEFSANCGVGNPSRGRLKRGIFGWEREPDYFVCVGECPTLD